MDNKLRTSDKQSCPTKVRELNTQDNIGIDSIPYQLVKKRVQDGFTFNILLVGETGIGKSTLISSLFNIPLNSPLPSHSNPKLSLKTKTHKLTEKGVNLALNVIETAGFGDQINRSGSVKPIIDYIETQFESYLNEELQVKRNWVRFKDTRVHVCLYLVCPTGHGLKSIDLVCMKDLQCVVNLVPVIAKSDFLTNAEVERFKSAIRRDLEKAGIKVYQFPEDEGLTLDVTPTAEELEEDPLKAAIRETMHMGGDAAGRFPEDSQGTEAESPEMPFNRDLEIVGFPNVRPPETREELPTTSSCCGLKAPFAVSASSDFVNAGGGTCVRGRVYPWGTMVMEDEEHSEFLALKEALVVSNMVDLMEKTHEWHYERFRRRRLMELGLSENSFEGLMKRRQEVDDHMTKDEEKLIQKFSAKTREMEKQMQERERSLAKEYGKELKKLEKQMEELLAEKEELDFEIRRFHKRKSVLSHN